MSFARLRETSSDVGMRPRKAQGSQTKKYMKQKAHINFTLNGEVTEVAFAPHKTLLEVLREDMGLIGTKHGCELGECGACTVLLNSVPVLSCLTSLDVRLEHFRDHACAQSSLAHVHATIYREDWGNLRGYLLLVNRDVGEFVWTTVQAAGDAYGLKPFGLEAERLLRAAEVSGRPRSMAPGAPLTVASRAS